MVRSREFGRRIFTRLGSSPIGGGGYHALAGRWGPLWDLRTCEWPVPVPWSVWGINLIASANLQARKKPIWTQPKQSGGRPSSLQ